MPRVVRDEFPPTMQRPWTDSTFDARVPELTFITGLNHNFAFEAGSKWRKCFPFISDIDSLQAQIRPFNPFGR